MGKSSYKNPEILKKTENYCSYQERCKKEVIEKLSTLKLDKSEIDDVISYLIKNDYINEERFALAFTQGKFRIKKWGKIKIILELKKRAINVNLIKRAINQIKDLDYTETFDKLSLKKYKSLTGSKDSKKRKFINFLSYRGWEYDLIIRKVNDFFLTAVFKAEKGIIDYSTSAVTLFSFSSTVPEFIGRKNPLSGPFSNISFIESSSLISP